MIYVISNPIQAEAKMFKIGFHTGSTKALLNRYSTAIYDLRIYFSYHVRADLCQTVEMRIHNALRDYRLQDGGNNEWFKVGLPLIAQTILEILDSSEPKGVSEIRNSDIEDLEVKLDDTNEDISDAEEPPLATFFCQACQQGHLDLEDISTTLGEK